MTKIAFTKTITKNRHGCLNNKGACNGELCFRTKLANHQMWLRHIPLVCSTCQTKKPKPMYAPLPCPASSSPTTFVQFVFKILTKFKIFKQSLHKLIVCFKRVCSYSEHFMISKRKPAVLWLGWLHKILKIEQLTR